jgi:hypothetical protein
VNPVQKPNPHVQVAQKLVIGNHNFHPVPVVVQTKRQSQPNKARVQGHVVVLNQNLNQVRHRNLLNKREIIRKPLVNKV